MIFFFLNLQNLYGDWRTNEKKYAKTVISCCEVLWLYHYNYYETLDFVIEQAYDFIASKGELVTVHRFRYQPNNVLDDFKC